MCRRKITKTNSYPTFVGKDRHINSILRNDRGYIVKPIFDVDGNFIKYVLTDIKDSDLIYSLYVTWYIF